VVDKFGMGRCTPMGRLPGSGPDRELGGYPREHDGHQQAVRRLLGVLGLGGTGAELACRLSELQVLGLKPRFRLPARDMG
jgi:hypothetical protein